MKTKILKISSLIAIVILALCMLMSYSSVAVFAATDETTVLDELQSDPDFDPAAYPDNAEDFSLQVIQIGEDEAKELYIYTFQSAHRSIELIATKISISYGYSSNGAGLNPILYDLELISSSDGFHKYHVIGFTPSKDGDRYYNIVAIYREYNSVVDDEYDEAFPTTDIAYSVGQQWYVHDINDDKIYEMNTFKTMECETVFNGHVLMKNGICFNNLIGSYDSVDAWFYCFNTDDYVIKHIYDADLNYSSRHVSCTYPGVDAPNLQPNIIYSDIKENQKITITENDEMTFSGSGLWSKSYSWNRILSSEDFIALVEDQGGSLDETTKSNIKSSQWVFSYLETSRDEYYAAGNVLLMEEYYDIYDVGLLRLHFIDINQNVYDLGVVNDLTDPDNNSDGELNSVYDALKEFLDTFILVVGLILGIIILVVLLNFVGPISSLLKYLIKAVVYVISFPFKMLNCILKKRR